MKYNKLNKRKKYFVLFYSHIYFILSLMKLHLYQHYCLFVCNVGVLNLFHHALSVNSQLFAPMDRPSQHGWDRRSVAWIINKAEMS